MSARDQATDAVLRRALRERAAGDDFDILGDVLRAVETTPQRRTMGRWFPLTSRFAPLALATTGLAVAVLIVLALVTRQGPDVGPSPVPGPTNEATSEPDPSASPGVPLGGGLILVTEPHEPRGRCEDGGSNGPFDVSTLDAGTGERTLLGTVAEDCSARWLTLQWAADREHVLITDELGQETLTLDTPTAAGRDLTFICCDFPTDVWEGGAAAFDGWVLSPAGDRVSAIHTSVREVPGQGGTGISDGIVVVNSDGSESPTLRLPAGSAIRGWAKWSPDSSELVVAGCNPCNHAMENGQPATGENHEHIYVVPVDGSPVRELLDETTGWLWTPAWSPDSSTFLTIRRECPLDEAPPQCSVLPMSSLLLVGVDDGAQRTLVTSDQLGDGFADFGLPFWSPDSGRIAFTAYSADLDTPHVFVIDVDGTNLADLGAGSLLQWSPDGEWLLVDRPDEDEELSDIWIMRADGSDARSIGSYLLFIAGVAW